LGGHVKAKGETEDLPLVKPVGVPAKHKSDADPNEQQQACQASGLDPVASA
jgi:hypothetical protein